MPARENATMEMAGAGTRPSPRTSRGFAQAASLLMGCLRVEPTGSHYAVSWRLVASASPRMGGAFAEGMIPGCGLGSLGSGSTLDIDSRPEAIDYDRDPVSLSAVRAVPDMRSDAGSEDFDPAVEAQEEESPESLGSGGSDGGNGGNGGGTMGESGLEATVRHQGETLKRLEGKIDSGLKEQREANAALQQRIDNGLKEQREASSALQQRIDNGLKEQREASSALQQRIDNGLKEQREANAALLQKIDEGNSALRQKIDEGDSALLQRIDEGNSALRQKIDEGDSALLQRIDEGNSALRQKIDEGDSALLQRIDDGLKSQGESHERKFRWILGGIGALTVAVIGATWSALAALFKMLLSSLLP